MSIFKTCPSCGHTTPLSEAFFKEFSGEGAVRVATAPLYAMPETIREMVDGIVESTGYGGLAQCTEEEE